MTSKVRASILMVFIFALGAAAGVLWQAEHGPRNRLGFHPPWKEHRITRLAHDLKLTPSQEESVRRIFQDAHERADQVNEEVAWDLEDIHRDSVEGLKILLTPEQVARFEEIHKKMHRRHHTPMEEPPGPPSPPFSKIGEH